MLAYKLPVEGTIESLAALPYDCDTDLVFVTPNDIIQIIDRHASGELSVEQVVEWADFLEIRDGVGFAPPHADRLKEIVPVWKKEVGEDESVWVEGDYRPTEADN